MAGTGDKFTLRIVGTALVKRSNPCSLSSKIGTGVSRAFVTLQSQQERKAENPILCVCVFT